jgi:hypothetical protein
MLLRRFVGPDGKLWVIDRTEGKQYPTHPRNAAKERDFNRVELEGVEPNAVEKAFSRHESVVAPAIAAVCEGRRLEPALLSLVLDFTALQITRVPQFRTMMENNKRHLERRGVAGGEDSPEADIPQEWSIQQMLDLALAIRPLLDGREWSLVVAADSATQPFVCTDRPAFIVAVDPGVPPFMGVATPGTEIRLALDAQMLLIGSYQFKSSVLTANNGAVERLNGQAVAAAHRFVFSPLPNYPDGVLGR